jgi:hypothetical protein
MNMDHDYPSTTRQEWKLYGLLVLYFFSNLANVVVSFGSSTLLWEVMIFYALVAPALGVLGEVLFILLYGRAHVSVQSALAVAVILVIFGGLNYFSLASIAANWG